MFLPDKLHLHIRQTIRHYSVYRRLPATCGGSKIVLLVAYSLVHTDSVLFYKEPIYKKKNEK